MSCALFFKEKQQPPPPKVPVNLYTVSSQPVIYYDQYPSTTGALSQVNLLFKEGSKVVKGQKLYEIDQSLYDDAYKQAVANLKVAQGTLVQSQQDADRYVYLNKYHAVAKQLYDHAMIIGVTVLGGMIASSSIAILIVPVLFVIFTRLSYGKKELAWLQEHHDELMEKAKKVEEQNIDPELEYDIAQAKKEHEESKKNMKG